MPRETGTRQGRRSPPTGDPHREEDPAEDPPPEGRATQGTYTEHTQTSAMLQLHFLAEWCEDGLGVPPLKEPH